MSDAQRLWNVCRQFVDKHRISCAEATIKDSVYEEAPLLVEEICKVIGYWQDPDAEEEDDG